MSFSTAVRPALRTWLVCCALLAGTVLLFGRAADYDFSNYDDPRYILGNEHVQAGLTRESIVWAFTGHADYWHPLTWLSHMIDWEIHGLNAGGHRLTSTLWHAFNALLAFLVLRRLTGAFWLSALSAALFAWHPLRVESVVWISERKDVMSGFFLLLTVWAYAIYAARRAAGRSAWQHYWLTLAAFLAGLMSKPVLVTAPLVLLALDFWPLRRGESPRALLLEKIPFFIFSAAVAVVTVVMQRHEGAFILELSAAERIANAFVSLARYLGKFFWPTSLTPFYPHPGTWPLGVVLAATAAMLALTFAAWRERSTRPWLLTGWLWFLALMLPVLGLLQVGFQAMADRYMYLPTLGLQLALLWTLREIVPLFRAPRLVAAACLAPLVAFAVRAWEQQATWRDPVTLLEHALAVTTRNATAHAFLAYTLAGSNRLEEAERHCARALEVEPSNVSALVTRADIETRDGRLADAVATYRELLRRRPEDAESSYKLGLLLLQQGDATAALPHLQFATTRRPDFLRANAARALDDLQHGRFSDALRRYDLALTIDPANADAHFGAGLALDQLGRADEALHHFESATERKPAHPAAHLEAGFIHLKFQRPGPAQTHFRAAVQSDASLPLAHLGLGRAAEQLGDTAQATEAFQRALELAPNEPRIRRAWAETLARRGRFADAAEHYRRLVGLQPGNAEAHAGLGFVLYLNGQREAGIAAWEEALRINPSFPGLRERLQRARR